MMQPRSYTFILEVTVADQYTCEFVSGTGSFTVKETS